MIEPALAKIRPGLMVFMPIIPGAILAVSMGIFIATFIIDVDVASSALAGLAAIAGATPVFIVICVVCALTYYIRVHVDGISSYDPRGSWKRDFVAWEDMHQIHKVSVLGVRYFRIEGSENGPLWIPVASFSDTVLVSAVRENAPQSKLAEWMTGRL